MEFIIGLFIVAAIIYFLPAIFSILGIAFGLLMGLFAMTVSIIVVVAEGIGKMFRSKGA